MKTLEEATTPIQQLNIVRHLIGEAGSFPNNGRLPLIIYKHALTAIAPKIIEELLESNGWVNSWRDSIFDYDHYHSTTHEVLVVFQGTAQLIFGADKAVAAHVEPGDVIIIPAGVSHRLENGDDDFKVVGAYPEGQPYNLLRGNSGERPKADEDIRAVARPNGDPIYGTDGPLAKNWE